MPLLPKAARPEMNIIKIRAIVPRRIEPVASVNRIQGGVNRYLRNFAFDFVREMQFYPAWRPWKYPPPRTGPRAGGRRTGQYGRGWSMRIRFTPNGVEIVNPIVYGVFVGGPRRGARGQRQAAALAARGWPSISTVGPLVARRNRPTLLRALSGRG